MENQWKLFNEKINDLLEKGLAMDAFEKYYAETITMQENETEPRIGKELNREQCGNFADKGIDIVKAKKEVDAFIDEVTIFHTHPEYQVPDVIYKQIKSLIASNKHRFLE